MANYAYEIFHEVARQKSFVRAAEALLLTPSAISHSIAGLEHEFGFPLFTRNKKGVVITEAGKEMLVRVEEILRSERLMREEAAEIAGLARGSVTIAGFSSFCGAWLPDIILEFREQYPGIDIRVLQGDYDEIYDWVITGQADVGFVSLRGSRDVKETPVHVDTFPCITPKGVAPKNGRYFTAEELQTLPVITTARGYRADQERYFHENGIRMNAHFSFTDDAPVLSFVEKGLGIFFLPKLTTERGDYEVDVYPLEPPFRRTVGIITPKIVQPSPATRALRAEIDRFLEERGLRNIRDE